MPSAMPISVVVPSYRRPASLRENLRSLERQATKPEQIIVVLRAGDGESEDVVRGCAIPQASVVFVDRPGVLAALEAGVGSCTGGIVAFIDDDAVAPPDWLTRVQMRMQGGIGAVGGRDRVASHVGSRTVDVGRVTNWGKLVGNHHLGTGGARDVDVLKGVNMAIRRNALAVPTGLKGHGAQPHFEIAMTLHAQSAGWRVLYDPEIVVDHYPAERHDNDRRDRPDAVAVRAASFNLVLCLLSFRRELFMRRAVYGLLLGDRGTPGVIRGLASVVRREHDVMRAVVPSLRGQLDALWRIRGGRPVQMLGCETRPLPDS